MATILQCPHCGNAARTAKDVPPGAKVTCTRCRQKFPFHPTANSPGDDTTEVAIETIPLAELLAVEERESSRGPVGPRAGRPPRVRPALDDREARALPVDDDEPVARYDSVTNSKLVDNPLALAARSSKEKLIGGKPVRFNDSRYKVGIVLVFAIGAAAYLGFWAFHALYHDIETAEVKAREARQKLVESSGPNAKKTPGKSKAGAEAKSKSKSTPTPAPALAPAPAPALPPPSTALVNGNAGTAVRLGDWEVSVPKAEVGQFAALGPQNYLFITVRVTNHAPGPRTYRYWSKPGRNTAISNENLAFFSLVPGTAPQDAERRMTSKETYDDVLVVEAAAARFELNVTLRLPDNKGGCVIHISPSFVTRMGN
jgi:hypothetical protein